MLNNLFKKRLTLQEPELKQVLNSLRQAAVNIQHQQRLIVEKSQHIQRLETILDGKDQQISRLEKIINNTQLIYRKRQRKK